MAKISVKRLEVGNLLLSLLIEIREVFTTHKNQKHEKKN